MAELLIKLIQGAFLKDTNASALTTAVSSTVPQHCVLGVAGGDGLGVEVTVGGWLGVDFGWGSGWMTGVMVWVSGLMVGGCLGVGGSAGEWVGVLVWG